MKTRHDLVSRSSSSSFIIADLAARSPDQLAKDIAKLCNSKNSKHHDKDLQTLNKCTFEYCIRNYVLLYFGRIVLGKSRTVITKDTYIDVYGYSQKEATDIWNKHIAGLRSKTSRTNAKACKDTLFNEVLDEERRRIIQYDPISVFGWPIQASKMPLYKDYSNTVKWIVDAAKNMNSLSQNQRPILPQIYSITALTVLNTKALIKSGIKVSFDGTIWSKKLISKIEKLLKDGKTVYYITLSHNRNAANGGNIYYEEYAPGIEADPQIEFILTESK